MAGGGGGGGGGKKSRGMREFASKSLQLCGDWNK